MNSSYDKDRCIPPENADFVLKAYTLSKVYNLLLLAGATYIVFVKNGSGWWYLLAILLMI